jgi:hypothetical protein
VKSRKILKLTLVALSVGAAVNAQAALYNVVEVTSTVTDTHEIEIGAAIQESTEDSASSTNHNSCFFASSIGGVDCDSFYLAGETRSQDTMAGQPVDGLGYGDEAPFGLDNAFSYAQTSTDFENYCDAQLLYATCSSWASVFWTEWEKELEGDTTPNSIAFVEDDFNYSYDNTNNTVINQLTSGVDVIGIKSSLGDERATVEAISTVTIPDTDTDGNSYDKSRAWHTDGTYAAGSVSTDVENDYGDYYTSKAAFWDGTSLVQIDWPSDDDEISNRLAQGSIRDFVIDTQDTTDTSDDVIYAVGFNTYDDDNNYMNATIFTANLSDFASSSAWTSNDIDNAQVKIDSTYTYSNTVATAINDNLVVIGESKRAGSVPQNGAAGNRLFVIDDASASTLTATYFSEDEFSGTSISGAGGQADAINNYNEIVGQIDTESTRENDGKPRRKRAFIYPYDGTGTNASRRAIFDNQAWVIDDLTNDGSASSTNNKYRILEATDINDAGVISATAIKCASGYESTEHDASCSDDETKVAVKLVPINGATSSDIIERTYVTETSSRSGAGLGLWSLILCGVAIWRRKF